MNTEGRRSTFLFRVKQFGGPLNEPAVLAQLLAQVEHESGGFIYVKEIWGPTAAQKKYEGRADLGNTEVGDGKRFMGRDLIQVTGRANYRALTAWVLKSFGATPPFEDQSELLESPKWLGIGAIWYFLTRKGLLAACRAGDIEKVTRLVNGGLNGLDDRKKRYDRIALGMIGVTDIREFQSSRGLVPDGIPGPKTRAALHEALLELPIHQETIKKPYVNKTPEISHKTVHMSEAEPGDDQITIKKTGLLSALLRALVAFLGGRKP